MDKKRKFLTEYFVNKTANFDIFNDVNFKETTDKVENKLYDNSVTWNSLLDSSRKLKIETYRIDLSNFKYGIVFDEVNCAKIYELAVRKILPVLMNQLDTDNEDEIIEKIVHFIQEQNLLKKSFYNLIRNIKNLNSELWSD